jgi:hypothetical protein
MARWMIAVAALLACGLRAPAQKLTDEEAKDGFVSLFNGKDFTGWRFSDSSALPDKLPDNWKVEDGVIKLSGGGSPHCASQWDYEDFDVRMEWRAMRDKYNSGFYIRSGRKVGANQLNLAKGGEGGVVGGKITGAKTVPELQKPPMEWNEWRVLAVGDKVTFWCNGQKAWDGSELKDLRGYLGLQAEGAPIEFRNLRIKELGYENLGEPKKWNDSPHWKWEDGVVTSDGKGDPLETADYKNYVLRLEWKADKAATGGVFLRGREAGKSLVNIGDLEGGSGELPGPGAKPAKKLDNPLGQWNYLELRVAGGKATVRLNGTVVVEAADFKGDATGAIALQSNGPGLQFRNIRIKEIKD